MGRTPFLATASRLRQGKLGSALLCASDDERQVVSLNAVRELLDGGVDAAQKSGSGGVIPQSGTHDFQQAPFAEFFAGRVGSFRDAVGVHDEQVTRSKGGFGDLAFPIRKHAEHGGRGRQAFELAMGAQEQRRVVPAIDVAQAPAGVFVIGEE